MTAETIPNTPKTETTRAGRPDPNGLFVRQVVGVLRLEVKKSLFSRRAFGLYFLAFSPLFLVTLWAMTPLPERMFGNPSETVPMYATIFQFYLRFSIYLSALLMFMSLFRNEILERSLHYYFLTPVKREVLVIGKYLSALISAWAAFLVGTVALYVMITIPWGVSDFLRYFFQGPGFGNLSAYVVTALMAVAGYGAVFMLAGLFFKNPVIIGFMIWAWEALNFLLPATLKKISVIYYLRSFYPVPPPAESLPGPLAIFRVLSEPPSPWLSVIGIVAFTGLVVYAAGVRARMMELSYGDD